MKMTETFCLPLHTTRGGVMPFVNDADNCTAFFSEDRHAEAAVHAVNCHDDLYDALLLAMQSIHPGNGGDLAVCNAALAKARGES